MSDDLMNTPGYTPSQAMSDKTEKCLQAAESFIPREGKSYACVLPKGHEGEHHGGGNCFKHGDYVGLRGCPVCFPDGAQVGFGSISDKTDLRAACEAALMEIHVHSCDPTLVWSQQVDIIESHIAPLIKSTRVAAIEECRIAYDAHNHVLNYPHTNPRRVPQDSTDVCLACGLMLSDPVHLKPEESRSSRIRALKEQP